MDWRMSPFSSQRCLVKRPLSLLFIFYSFSTFSSPVLVPESSSVVTVEKLLMSIKSEKWNQISSQFRKVNRLSDPWVKKTLGPLKTWQNGFHLLARKKIPSTCFKGFGPSNPFENFIYEKYRKKCLINALERKRKGRKTVQLLQDNLDWLARYLPRELNAFIKRDPKHPIIKSLLVKNYLEDLPKRLLNTLRKNPQFPQFIISEQQKKKQQYKIFRSMARSLEQKLAKSTSLGGNFAGNFEREESFLRLNNFGLENRRYLPGDKLFYWYSRIGKKLLYSHHYIQAFKFYSLARANATGEDVMESHFQFLFGFIFQDRYKEALQYIYDHNLLNTPLKLSSKLRYWMGQIAEENKNESLSRNLYTMQVKLGPLSYYTVLSLKRLDELKSDFQIDDLLFQSNRIPYKLTKLGTRLTDKIQVFKKFQAQNCLKLQIKWLKWHKNDELFEKDHTRQNHRITLLMDIYEDLGEHLKVFKIGHNAFSAREISFTRSSLTKMFPAPYLESIKKSNPEIDPFFVLGLIRQESAFNPFAISSAGARGLMQLMPRTARMINRRLRKKDLYSVSKNIKTGSKYLRRLIKKYNGDMVFALSAYNAGEGNLRKWRRSYLNHPDKPIRIEMIPFQETQKYVKLIYRNFFFYHYLNDNTEIVKIPLNEALKVGLSRGP